MLRRASIALLWFGLACSSTDDAGTGSGREEDDPCPTGQRRLDGDGDFCVPLLPAHACPAGSSPHLGEEACRPVGWHECPEGFVADPSGWGCADVQPAEACAAGLRDALGSEACQPIGDCAASFPPADATVFVDASYADGELDASHFDSLAAALDAARDGDVVAVQAGTYAGKLIAPSGSVTVIGRCASQVRVDGGGDEALVVGIGDVLDLRGVTITGGAPGVRVHAGVLRLQDVELADNTSEALRASGGDVELSRCVVRGTEPPSAGAQAMGVLAYGGARVSLVDSAIVDNVEGGVGCIDAGTEVSLEGSVVRATRPQPGNGGIGAKAFDGSRLTIRRSALVENHQASVMIGGRDTVAEITSTVVRDTQLDDTLAGGGMAWGVISRLGATVTVEDSSVVRTPVMALEADGDSSLTLRRVVVRDGQATGWLGVALGALVGQGARLEALDSAFVASVGMAVVAEGSGSALLDATLVHATLPTGDSDPDQPGRGGTGIAVLNGGHAELVGCAVTDSAEVALNAFGDGSLVVARDTLVANVRATAASLYGHGVLVKDGARVELVGSVVRDSAAVGLVFAAASGSVSSSFVHGAAVGVHVQQGAVLREADPLAATGPLEVTFSPDTHIWDVGARVGNGELALPDPIQPPPIP